jgi:hypothetical protein
MDTPTNNGKRQQDRKLARNRKKRANRSKRAGPVKEERKGEKVRAKQASDLMKAGGARGVNPIAAVNHVSPLPSATIAVENQDDTVDTQSHIAIKTIANAWAGVVCYCIRHGFLSQCSFSGGINPANALQFATETTVAAFNGNVPDVEAMNHWIWEFFHAIAAKNVPFKTSNVGYSVIFDTLPAVSYGEYDLGIGAENYTISFGVPTDFPGPNRFNDIAVDPTPYDSATGAAAFQAMLPFLPKGTPWQERTPDPGSKNTTMRFDVSAYSTSYPRLGSSYGGPGGICTSIESECFIQCPMLATFISFAENVAFARGSREVRFRGGGPSWSLCRMSELSNVSQMRNKKQAMIKFYNFDEFFEVFSLIIGFARLGGKSSTLTDTPLPSYPLTAQRAQIMLRQALIPYFWNHMGQEVRWSNATTGGEVQTLFPFTVGTNGYPGPGTNGSVLLPRVFTEMIRAISRAEVRIPGRQVAGKPGSTREVIDFVPILGRLTDQPIPIQYDLGTENLYAVDPLEVPIDIVDLSWSDVTSTRYVDVNGEELTAIIDAHNEWINQYSNYLTTLAPIGRERGIGILNTVYYTNVMGVKQRLDASITQPAVATMNTPNTKSTNALLSKKVPSVKKLIGSGVPRHRVGQPTPTAGSDYFAYATDLYMTSSGPIYKDVASYMDIFILPAFCPLSINGQGSIVAYQTYMMEGLRVAKCMNNDPDTVFFSETAPVVLQRHSLLAQADIKTPTSGPKEIEVQLNSLSETGHGGFFTGLARTLGSVFLGPEVGGMIGDAVGGIFGDV